MTSDGRRAVTNSKCTRTLTDEDNAEELFCAWIKDGDVRTSYVIQWNGGAFEGRDCWISASKHIVTALNAHE